MLRPIYVHILNVFLATKQQQQQKSNNKANEIVVAQNKLRGVVYFPIKCPLFYLD